MSSMDEELIIHLRLGGQTDLPPGNVNTYCRQVVDREFAAEWIDGMNFQSKKMGGNGCQLCFEELMETRGFKRVEGLHGQEPLN